MTAPTVPRTPAERLSAALATVHDPEIQVLTIGELGVLRSALVDEDGRARISVTPTYVGCPAMERIRADIRDAVRAAGFADVLIETVLSPAWSSQWLGTAAREKLREAGIAPPTGGAGRAPGAAAPAGRPLLPFVPTAPPCPRCGCRDTRELTRFGSTACKALWRCEGCSEPFDHFKDH